MSISGFLRGCRRVGVEYDINRSGNGTEINCSSLVCSHYRNQSNSIGCISMIEHLDGVRFSIWFCGIDVLSYELVAVWAANSALGDGTN